MPELIHYLGKGALNLLLLTLLVSPLAKRWRQGQLIKLRRPLGLWCFAWALLHFMAWLGLDLQFDWGLIGGELVKRSYIVVGMVALLLLAALSITSLPALQRRMGAAWQKLHNWVYAIALLVPVHYWWSLKSGWGSPSSTCCCPAPCSGRDGRNCCAPCGDAGMQKRPNRPLVV